MTNRLADRSTETYELRKLYGEKSEQYVAERKHADRLRAALTNIASQQLSSEHESDDADYEGAYDTIVTIAREAMKP